MLVRYMSKADYAWFTLAASFSATLNLLADGGVSTGLTAIGGIIHGEQGALARLMQQGLSLSFRLIFVGFTIASPLFYWLYIRIGATPGLALTVLLVASLSAWPLVSTVLLNVANRLTTRVGVIQTGEAIGALVRLGVGLLLWAGGWLTVIPAVLATAIAVSAQAVFVRVKSSHFLHAPSCDVSYNSELRGYIRSLYGNHVFFCIQAQVATWVIGWLAGSAEVADLGALARLGVLFMAMTSPVYYLAVPAIARLREPRLLKQRVAVALGAATCMAAAVVMLSYWLPSQFLWILGGNYDHLAKELPLALAAQGGSMVASLAWALVLARGWVRHAWITIVTTLVGFAGGAVIFPLNTVAGMLKFNLVTTLPTLFVCMAIIIFNLFRRTLSANQTS